MIALRPFFSIAAALFLLTSPVAGAETTSLLDLEAKQLGGPVEPLAHRYLTSLPEPVGGPVQWNFQKYLVDRNDRVVARYSSSTLPGDPGLVAEIERLLASPAPVSLETFSKSHGEVLESVLREHH